MQRMRLPWPHRSKETGGTEGTIRTSQPGWFEHLAKAYRDRQPVLLVDDARVGLDPQSQSLAAMGIKAGISAADWTAVGVAVGMSAAGMMMVVLAFLDPEPTSKLGLLIGGGAVCVLTGGLTAVAVLTRRRPPNIEMSAGSFKISWE